MSHHVQKEFDDYLKTAQSGAVTLIQRFGNALNLNVHFHMLFLDGIYTKNKYGKTTFQRTDAPIQEELVILIHCRIIAASYRIYNLFKFAKRLDISLNISHSKQRQGESAHA